MKYVKTGSEVLTQYSLARTSDEAVVQHGEEDEQQVRERQHTEIQSC